MENLTVGQEVIGKFQTSRGKGMTPMLIFPHGKITEITEKGFKVKYQELIGEYPYQEKDIGKIVYLQKKDTRNIDEQLDYKTEKDRLGIED